ncbi:hypothetical protein EBESD8_16440 [Rhodococcus aetherivorans]|nr:hypothetical protein EBESD8_16440 [Rhodococcus aetherivorans]
MGLRRPRWAALRHEEPAGESHFLSSSGAPADQWLLSPRWG